LVTAAITAAERAVAVEAITCVIAGNTVRIGATRLRTAREIAAIVQLVAGELEAKVVVSVGQAEVELSPRLR
jgi:phage tail sheath gpL-like